jgi:menaquinol-cytochrome c reductase cytochrome b/c subunit
MTLWGDFAPAVAAGLVQGSVSAEGCAAAVGRESALTGEIEPEQPALDLPSPVVPQGQPRRNREVEAGRVAVAQSGCLACHRIGDSGNGGPGPNLTHIGAKLSAQEIARALVNPRAPMPSFRHLQAQKFQDIVRYLAALR